MLKWSSKAEEEISRSSDQALDCQLCIISVGTAASGEYSIALLYCNYHCSALTKRSIEISLSSSQTHSFSQFFIEHFYCLLVQETVLSICEYWLCENHLVKIRAVIDKKFLLIQLSIKLLPLWYFDPIHIYVSVNC